MAHTEASTLLLLNGILISSLTYSSIVSNQVVGRIKDGFYDYFFFISKNSRNTKYVLGSISSPRLFNVMLAPNGLYAYFNTL